VVAQQSVTDLFLAGIVPGLIIACALCLYVFLRSVWMRSPVGGKPSLATIIPALKRSTWAVITPVLILGGIYGGAFTPTEAAGVACWYSILISVYVYRELTWLEVFRITIESCVLVAQIMILVAAAGAYSWLITTSGMPAALVEFIKGLHLQGWSLLLVINFVLLTIGSVLEPPAAILILTPLLTPLIADAGINPLHFGLVITVNLAIGMSLPPFGLNLFASHALFKVPLPTLYRGAIPFLTIYIAILILVTYVPAITLEPVRWLRAFN